MVEEVEALLQEASNTKGHMLDDIAECVVVVVLADYSKLVDRLGSMLWGSLGDMVAVLLLGVALVALQEVVEGVLGVVQHHHSSQLAVHIDWGIDKLAVAELVALSTSGCI